MGQIEDLQNKGFGSHGGKQYTINHDITPLKKRVLVSDMHFGETKTAGGIILVDDDNIDIKNKLENFVIISDSEKLYSKGVLKIENYPINIQKLVEIINIQFLKNKFQQQNNIKVGIFICRIRSNINNIIENDFIYTRSTWR